MKVTFDGHDYNVTVNNHSMVEEISIDQGDGWVADITLDHRIEHVTANIDGDDVAIPGVTYFDMVAMDPDARAEFAVGLAVVNDFF